MVGELHQKDEDRAPQDKRGKEITKGDLCRSIGMGLQKARYNAGYTQQEVADCLNFNNVKKVSRHESGTNVPNIEDIILYFYLYNIRTIYDIIPDYSIEVIDKIFGSSLCEKFTINRKGHSVPDDQDDIEEQISVLVAAIRKAHLDPQQLSSVIMFVHLIEQSCNK